MAGTEDRSAADDAGLVDEAWSVARLNETIAAALDDASGRFPTYVVGEVSDVGAYDFGTFFELRDVEEEAVIPCLAWSRAVESFDHDLEEGAAGVVEASVDFYADQGEVQLVVSDYWPVGESDRARELEALRAELADEGLLAADRKRPLPAYPDCVGVVTSPVGSAREDFTSAVGERAPGVTVKLCGATVQGEGAAASLVEAVRTLEADPTVEVVVVTRGGGADAELWCFNEEPVVRAIANCSTPVVVAVGHEDDETLAEAVADERAMTPTDAGVTVTPDVAALRRSVEQLETRVETAYRQVVADGVDTYERRVESAYAALRQAATSRQATRRRAAALERRVSAAYRTLVADRTEAVERRLDAAVREVEHAVETETATARAALDRVDDLEARIEQAYRARVERELTSLATRIDAAHRRRAAAARVEAEAAEARRLRVAVVVLAALLVVGAAAVGLLVL